MGRNLQDHPLFAGLCFAARKPLPAFNNNLEGSTLFARSRTDFAVADLMLISIQIAYASAELAARSTIRPNAFCIAPGLMRVESRGYLRMRSARFDGRLEIQPNFLTEPADIEASLAGLQLGLDLAAQPAFRELAGEPVVGPRTSSREDLKAFLREACCSYWHPVGTCAMGPNPDADVDDQLRVRGVTGLRTADASIMPTITRPTRKRRR